jgi:hypothetical protein
LVCTEAFSAGENADAFAAVRFHSSVCHGRKRKRFRRSAITLERLPRAKMPAHSPCGKPSRGRQTDWDNNPIVVDEDLWFAL